MMETIFPNWRRWVFHGLIIVFTAIAVVPTVAQRSAFLSGRHTCNLTTGRYEVTWFVYNAETDPNHIMRITTVSRSIDGFGPGTVIGPDQLAAGFETMPEGFTGRITLVVGVVWEHTDPDTAEEYSDTVRISGHCYDNPTYTPPAPVVTPSEDIPHSVVPTGTPTAAEPDETSPGSGINLTGCGRACPPFRVYHTDEAGGWEIFRLDGADEITRTSIHENLSMALDPDTRSIAPSLSPYNEWIVFSSDRDGNWELYVAPTTDGDADDVQRVTFNTVAIDTDPVWGPNNIVVYETTFHGTWDLYALDMSTGEHYRLTDDSGNDINAYWSPDGLRLVFQSDRPDTSGARRWQIYELDPATLQVKKLSDGSTIDVDPVYNSTGDRIVFRSYTDAKSNSVIETMNADGTKRTAISDPSGDATNALWSPNDTFIAYQSDLDGDLDIYIYEVASGATRHLTGNTVDDYAPTWHCSNVRLLWTSDIAGDPNIFEVNVLPMTGAPIAVDPEANQMTFEASSDIYPMSFPPEENASREGKTVLGDFGTQTVFLNPDAHLTPVEPSTEGAVRTEWQPIDACAPEVRPGSR
jgi:hypothetical protein